MNTRCDKYTVGRRLSVCQFKITQVSHDRLSLVKPLVPTSKHCHLAGRIKITVKTFYICRATRGSKGWFAIVTNRVIWLYGFSVIYRIQCSGDKPFELQPSSSSSNGAEFLYILSHSCWVLCHMKQLSLVKDPSMLTKLFKVRFCGSDIHSI